MVNARGTPPPPDDPKARRYSKSVVHPDWESVRMSDRSRVVQFEDCWFYHTIHLPKQGLVEGPWDLRGGEESYTGHVDFCGKTVLEIGPASGGLTAYMERQGAVVTCIETSDHLGVDVLPRFDQNILAHQTAGRNVLRRIHNAWLYSKSELGLSAAIYRGDVNSLPSQLGKFDISFLGAILVHCRSPFDVIHQACIATLNEVVVTDLLTPGLEDISENMMRFSPSEDSMIYWWAFSPGAIVNMLRMHGFNNCETTLHAQMHYSKGDFRSGLTPMKMFTVVGRR